MAVWSEILFSELAGASRLDAEYYDPELLLFEKSIKDFPGGWATLEDLAELITDGDHLKRNYVDDGILFLTSENFSEHVIDYSSNLRIAPDYERTLARARAEAGAVFLTKTGKWYGKAVVCRADKPRFNISADVAKIRLRPDYDPFFLACYLNSSIGYALVRRETTGGSRDRIILDNLRMIPVPIVYRTESKYREIIDRIADAHSRSLHLYSEAEGLFFSELCLTYLDLSMSLFYERAFSATQQAARLDAEFFQPQYQHVYRTLEKTKPKRIARLDDFLSLLTNGHTPLHHDLSDGDVPFLTAEHVFDFRIDYDSDKRILQEHHDGELKRTRLVKGDCLITIKGRIGNAAIADEFSGPININQDVALFRLKNGMPPYYLMAYLNSPAGKAFTHQYCTGQINPFLGLGNIRLLPIPVYDDSLMQQIADKTENVVLNARAARDESRRLLEEAKQMVEEAVLGGGH